MLDRLLKLMERTIAAVSIGTAVTLLPLMIGARVWEIYSRNVLNKPVMRTDWIEGEALFLLVLLTLAYAYSRDAHVRVDILRERLSPQVQAVLELTGILLFALPFVAVTVWFGIDRVTAAAEIGMRSVLAFGRAWGWIIQSALPLGIVLIGLACLVAAGRNLRFLLTGRGRPVPEPEASL